ncbi:MAG: chloride channel protein [Pseudomonadota bacterium]
MPEIIRRLPTIIYNWIEPNLSGFNQDRQLTVWIVAIAVGIAVSAAAIVFRELIGLVQLVWLFDRSENVVSASVSLPWYVILLAPVIGGALVGWGLVTLLPARRTGGVADVIEARAMEGRDVELKPALWSAGITALSLGAGASAGREGPMVHLGAGITTAMTNLFDLPHWSKKTLLGCGAAAAVSASFNAPIAGVLFAHEIVLGHYARRSFVPIVISAVGGTLLSRLWFGDVAAFIIPDYQITSFWEFPAFALLGLVCALVSVIFQFALVGTDYVARNINISLFYRPIIGGFMIGGIAVFFPEILGVGYEATDMALKNQLGLELLIILIIVKTAATAITLASRFGGGVFSPAIYLGAMTGAAYGLIASAAFPELASSEGLYAILGMGAVAAAVIGAPFSTTMIVFELTGGYTLSIALLLAVSISTGINQAIHGHSFFEWQLELRGLFLRDGPHKYVMRITKVSDFYAAADRSIETQKLEADEEGNLPPYVRISDNLETALRTFDNCGLQSLPVVDSARELNIVGEATQNKALSYFNNALVASSEEEHKP